MVKVVGYFVELSGTLEDRDVFVAIDDGGNRYTSYSVKDGHAQADKGYVKDCKEITKEQYKEATKGYHTPEDYL